MELPFLLLFWGISDPMIAEMREMPRSFIIKLNRGTQVSGRLGMSGARSPRHAQNPFSGERRKTLLITHLITPTLTSSYVHHSSHQLTTTFYSITVSLKRPFVPKSDVKQWFTTVLLLLLLDKVHFRLILNVISGKPCQIDHYWGTKRGVSRRHIYLEKNQLDKIKNGHRLMRPLLT